MRVFSVELRSSFLPWAKAGPLKGPRSRWTGIPWYPEHRQCVRATTNYNEPTLCTDREHLPNDLLITTRGRFGDER
jgi:hypothetical protein